MIQTGGYKVDYLPRYTPVDPQLVAFQPTTFLNGLMNGVRTVGLFNRAKQEAQLLPSETEAIMSGNRLAAAKNTSGLQVLPAEQAAKMAALSRDISVTPIQGQADIAKLKSLLQALPSTTERTIAENTAATGEANLATSTIPTRTKLAQIRTEGELNRAPTEEEYKGRLADLNNIKAMYEAYQVPAQNAIALRDLNTMAQTGTNLDWQRKMDQARMELERSQGEYYHNHGLYMLGLGRQPGRPIDVVHQLNEYQNVIDKINKEQIGANPKENLSWYENKVYGDNQPKVQIDPKTGEQIVTRQPQNTGIFGLGGQAQKNPRAEQLLTLRRQYEGAMDALRKQGASQLTAPSQSAAQTPTGGIPMEHIQTLIKNKDNPEAIQEFNDIYGQGMAEGVLSQPNLNGYATGQ